jgi:hypothetical protein
MFPTKKAQVAECARIERLVSLLIHFVICSELSEVFAVLDADSDLSGLESVLRVLHYYTALQGIARLGS